MSEKTKLSREEFVKEFLDHLSVTFLKPIAEGFFENIRRVEYLTQMPLMMFGMLQVEKGFASAFQEVTMKHWVKGTNAVEFKEGLKEVLNRVESSPKDPDFVARCQKLLDDTLANPTYGAFLKTAIQVLYSAAISGSWTAFECLATDLWVTALNEEPLLLAQTAISSLDPQEPGELTSKQIPVGLAARYGFDLRRCLGTVLKPKFDFTGVSGIQRAYKVFTPSDDFLKGLLMDRELSDLEATRHVIVHRAGRIDDEYIKRTNSTLGIGTVLMFSEQAATRFAAVSAQTSTGLLAFVNDWFLDHKKTGAQG